ncbi:putative secreted protein (Por secretion system target) [Dyadobacter jejuensis]|uniref:Putative secreted protein (Por secretion system target) n=1 Tax=Dyadobacter jejuensis TaxID=1082580 RepID=A0A316A835_9BACT|nr:T9SS type A sorting domain-containing protein [Dyadobacter jejuensis]PWJ54086.1 putative secreted protein (Por secretion system target) [Dyadobacter jejuensis]
MKKSILSLLALLSFGVLSSYADTNPFVTNPDVSPAPILGSSPYATITFYFGNSGSDIIPILDIDGNPDPITVRVSLAKGTYDNVNYPDPISAVGGSYKKYFSWAYNPATETYTGTQILDLPADDAGPITIGYKVTVATGPGNANNGFNVNLAPSGNAPNGPGSNLTDDDNAYEYTYVSGSLPVTLAQFDVTKEGSTALLYWETTDELNSDYFQVEHSANVQNWNSIGVVNSFGESTQLRTYQFTHREAQSGLNYYRLKMVDKDGTFAYSRIRSVDFDDTNNSITVFPNPASDRLRIGNVASKKINDVKVYNQLGQSLIHITEVPDEGIDVSKLPTGIYMLTLKTIDGLVSHHKMTLVK